jgi:hypothetical protein
MSGKPDDSATNGKIRTLAEGARMRQPRLAGRGHGMPCPYKVKPKRQSRPPEDRRYKGKTANRSEKQIPHKRNARGQSG